MTNIFFRKKNSNKFTWSARGSKSIIDYIFVNEKLAALVEDTHVYRGPDIYSDHYLVLSKIRIFGDMKESYIKKKIIILMRSTKYICYRKIVAGHCTNHAFQTT